MILIYGLDLSFNSTGITCMQMDDSFVGEKITFGRVVYDLKLTRKRHLGINTLSYAMPHSVTPSDLLLDPKDENNYTQTESTLRAISCSNAITSFCLSTIKSDSKPNAIIVCIENYIMPSFGGPNSLPEVSGLITLQAFVRKFFLTFCHKYKITIKMLTPSPSSVKKMFAGIGKAEKEQMYDAFVKYWKGLILLPTSSPDDVKHINDVIDSFAMTCWAYKSLINHKDNLYNVI